MATTKVLSPPRGEDDYIDMDISSTSLLCCNKFEFEFQMSSSSKRETSPSPADELFYKGKLLPLHLPPRLQMVENLLRINVVETDTDTTTPTSTNISGEINPEEYFKECSSKKKSWVKKINLGLKLKASRAYIKNLFTKSDESKPKSCSSRYSKEEMNPFSLVKSIERERLADEELLHRNSFSGAINWHSIPKSACSSSSSSFSSVNSMVLKRSSNVDSEVESPIEGAIAHCKKSLLPARRSVSDVGYSSSLVNISTACENKEKPRISRG